MLSYPSAKILRYCYNYDGFPSTTTDDRFILKQIKSIEISSFEQFAPQYFEHVNRALEEGVREVAALNTYI